jgi:hypothetical protein
MAPTNIRGWVPTQGRVDVNGVASRFNFQTAKKTPNATPHSRGAMRPSCAWISRPKRGRGECRAHGAPAASCAKVEGRKHTSSHGRTGITRHSRTQWSHGLYRALPGDRAFLPPSSPRSLLLKNLTPASGRQDHTVLPYATRLRLSLRRAWYPSAKTPA